MQQNRLFKIMYYLIDKGNATASQLADKFEVSVRTIYRDIDVLSQAGIPIYSESGRNGGIYLMNDFVLDKAILSEKEKEDILTALLSLTFTGNDCENDTLEKLSALFNVQAENWFELDFSRWGNKNYDNEKFELLKSAIIHRKAIRIDYAGSYKIIKQRRIHPLKLMYKSRAWYLKAYCTERQDFRIFKLSRILNLELLEDQFIPIPFPDYQEPSEQTCINLTLRFPKDMAYRVYDEFDSNEVKRQENGDLIVFVTMPCDSWLVGFLLSFGTQVEVVEPVDLRKALAETAKEIYEKNKP